VAVADAEEAFEFGEVFDVAAGEGGAGGPGAAYGFVDGGEEFF